MDLVLDQNELRKASVDLRRHGDDMSQLADNLTQAVDRLRVDWDSDAGRAFFEKFDTSMIKHIRDHAIVFNHMSENLSTAVSMYEEIFQAANTVANAQF